MRHFYRYIILFTCVSMLTPLKAQYKTIYRIDGNDVTDVASMKIIGMHDVGKGNKVLLIGDYSGKDNLNNSISPFYSLETGYEGEGLLSHYYKDANPSLSTRAYGLYVGGSSGTAQTVSRINDDGDVLWTINTGHHEIHDLLFDTTLNHLVVLGQGESVTNVHDFYVALVDTSGTLLKGYNYGNTGFELPSTIVKTPQGYLAVGITDNGPFKDILLLSLDTGLNILWSKSYNRSSYVEHVVNSAVKVEGKDVYAITGYVKGAGVNPDSAFYFSVDNQGSPLQYKVFVADSIYDLHANAITYNPELKNFIIGGDFTPIDTNFTQPFVMQCDSDGTAIWGKDYGEGLDSTSESIEDVLYLKDSSYFLVAGNYLYQDVSGYNWEVFMLKDEYTSVMSDCNAQLNITSYNRAMQVQQTGFIIRDDYFFNSSYNLLSVATGVEDQQKECEIIVAVEDFSFYDKKEILIYPNPAKQKVIVSSHSVINSISIVDVYGRIVLHKNYPPSHLSYFKSELDITNLKSGLYMLVFNQGKEGLKQVKTLIVSTN